MEKPMTKEEVNQIKWKRIDIEELRASIPRIRETIASLEEAKKVSQECLRTEINI